MQDLTRERILDAAEALFSEHGFAKTSLRMITTSAGVNLAAVNYHFGSKRALIQEVFTRRLVPINAERLQNLATLERHDTPPTVEQLLEAFIGPTFKPHGVADPGEVRFMRLLGRTQAGAATSLRQFVHSLYDEVLERFKTALAQVLPDIPEIELYWRLHFLLGSVSYSLAAPDTTTLINDCQLQGQHDNQALLQRLIPFLAAGLAAPVPAGLKTQSEEEIS